MTSESVILHPHNCTHVDLNDDTNFLDSTWQTKAQACHNAGEVSSCVQSHSMRNAFLRLAHSALPVTVPQGLTYSQGRA